jgi:protein-tyrosine phosphatase
MPCAITISRLMFDRCMFPLEFPDLTQHIVNCAVECKSAFSAKEEFTYLRLDMRDRVDESIVPAINIAYDFIEAAIAQSRPVLIHCHVSS